MKNKNNMSARKAMLFCAILIIAAFVIIKYSYTNAAMAKKAIECFENEPKIVSQNSETAIEDFEEETSLGNEERDFNLYLVSSFSTSFASSSENRKHNIKLSSSAINNIIILPKDELSFNRIVGERSERKGYKNAKVIENGLFVEGIGGGVCQVSTTLYVAAIKAGFVTTELHSHSIPSSYVPPSMDATVSYGYFDLKLYNPTNGIFIIKTEIENDSLTVLIYSTEKQKYNVVLESKIVERIFPEEIVTEIVPNGITPIFDENGAYELAKKRIGIKSELVAKYYDGTTLVFEKKLRSDYYREKPRIVIKKPADNLAKKQNNNLSFAKS